MLCHGGTIDHSTHVTGIVAQYSSESEYNVACNSWIPMAYFIMLNNKLLNNNSDGVLEQATIVLL